MHSLMKRRIKTGAVVGTGHFFLALFVTVGLLAAGNKPINDPSDNWLLIAFPVVMFPTCVLALFGAFTSDVIALILVPVTSILWAVTFAKLLVRR